MPDDNKPRLQNTGKVTASAPDKKKTVSPPPSVSKIKRPAKSVSTTSIKRALTGDFESKKKQISAKEQFQMYSKADEVEPFTEEQLKEKWNAFLPRLEEHPSVKATLSTLPKIEEDWTLTLEVDNRIQDELLVNFRSELVSFLRKELHNSKINLKTVVTDIVREKLIYTDVEKFQAMAKKNPNLALLKRTLGLDF